MSHHHNYPIVDPFTKMAETMVDNDPSCQAAINAADTKEVSIVETKKTAKRKIRFARVPKWMSGKKISFRSPKAAIKTAKENLKSAGGLRKLMAQSLIDSANASEKAKVRRAKIAAAIKAIDSDKS